MMRWAGTALVGTAVAVSALASDGPSPASGQVATLASTLFALAAILLAAKLGSLVERLRQPAVLGELIAGVVLGNAPILRGLFESAKHDPMVEVFAAFGAIVLLFHSGLREEMGEMAKVGARAFCVACVGVAAPFAIAYATAPWLFPGLPWQANLFLGAALTATSVGITVRTFADCGKSSTREAKIVIGAAVIDDVIGLIILAVVSAVVTAGVVDVGSVVWITAKAMGFLAAAIVFGRLGAPFFGRHLSRLQDSAGTKLVLAMSFCLVFAACAEVIGLAPIVGAFAAGLVLDPLDFREFASPPFVQEMGQWTERVLPDLQMDFEAVLSRYADRHVEELVEPLYYFFVPIFFVVTGLRVDVWGLVNPQTALLVTAITLIAIGGKVVSGIVAGAVDRVIVGFGMVPRGEVGLIFATMGLASGVFTADLYSVVVGMVVLTTLVTPPILAYLLRRRPTTPVTQRVAA